MSSVGAGLCPARCGNPLTLVGATLAVARRPTAPHARPRVIAKPVRTLAVAIRNPTPVPKHNKSIPGPPSEGPGIHFLQEVSHFTQIFFFSIQAAPVTDSTMAAAIMTMWLLSPVAGALNTRGMVSVLVAWHTWQV